jgi:ribosomal protein S16
MSADDEQQQDSRPTQILSARLALTIGQFDPEVMAAVNSQQVEIDLTAGWQQCGALTDKIREAIESYKLAVAVAIKESESA